MLKLNVKKISVVAVVIVFLAGGFYLFDFSNRENTPDITLEEKESEIAKVEEKQPTQEPSLIVHDAPKKQLPAYKGESVRDLNPDLNFVASMGAAFSEKYQKNLASIAKRIDKDPKNYDDWLAVAYIKKLFNNYPGTRDALEYAKVVNPENPIAYFNLGELYGYELREPEKAEENYKSALRLDPYHLNAYIGFANFYEDVAKSLKKAEEVLLAALDKIPNTEPNLFATIGSFYRDQKEYVKAIEYFEKAINAAGDPRMKKSIQDEIDYIRSKQAE